MGCNAFKFCALILAVAPLLLTGCVANHYELELTVEGDTLHRKLVCSRSTGQDPPNLHEMPDGELERIAGEYGVETPENEARKFEFSGEFTQQTPDDVGGAGTLTMYETSLGRTWAYVERFRGDDELTTSLASREQAVDELVAALEHWLAGELGDTRVAERVQELINEDLHQDLHNVSAYAWLAKAVEELNGPNASDANFDIIVRLGQFGLERDYLTPQDVPELAVISADADRSILPLIRRMLANKLGPDVAVHKWRFLDSPDSVAASINKTLSDYPPYVAFTNSLREANPDRESSELPPPADWIGDLALRSLGIGFGGGDAVRVTLHCPTRPFRTNGQWSDEDGTVAWDKRIPYRDAGAEADQGVLPVVLFAFWCVADEQFQTEHFGSVLLREAALAEYVMWRESLPDAEAAEWDRFLGGLRLGSDLRMQVDEFRFASDPPEDAEEGGAGLSDRGRELILSGLDGKDE